MAVAFAEAGAMKPAGARDIRRGVAGLGSTAIALRTEAELAPAVRRILAAVFADLKKILPEAEAEHVGATSVPGAVTKGDVDVVLRVPPDEFASAVNILSTRYDVKQRKNWTKAFASFGDDTGYPLPLGVQLVAKGARPDFLTVIRDHLAAKPAALAEYNQLKLRHAADGAAKYWQAKHVFFTRLLAAAGKVAARRQARSRAVGLNSSGRPRGRPGPHSAP